jgi:hypothetical protein
MSKLVRRVTLVLLSFILSLTGFGVTGFGDTGGMAQAAEPDPQAALNAKQHPYLVLHAEQYAEMRSKASQPGSVWEAMKNDAINDMNEIIYSYPVPGTTNNPPGLPETETGVKLASAARLQGAIVSTATMGYILDPANKQVYMDKTEAMINQYDQYVTPRLMSEETWYMVVQPSAGLFNMIIALDIMHDDFAAQGKLAALESKIETAMAFFFRERTAQLGWTEAVYSIRGTWGLYTKDWAMAKQGIDDYIGVQNLRINEDGMFNGGARYADERLNSPVFTRDSKSYFMDVIEFQNLQQMTGDNNYAPEKLFYNNPKFQMLFEWIYGYSFSPVTRKGYGDDYRRKEYVIFGDTGFYGRDASYIHEDLSNNFFAATASLWRMPRFSNKAFAYAGLAHGNPEQPMGRLWHYLFYNDVDFPEPAPIPSRIFPTGNAIFYEQWDDYQTSNQILSGYLWSVQRRGSHSRYDMNAIHLTAYGENVLMGVGYPGYTEMMNNQTYFLNSVSHNTLMIDGQKHALEYGAGLEKHSNGNLEAITNKDFGYASGSTGKVGTVPHALTNGEHIRNFIQVNGKNGVNGYWVLFDDVDAVDTGATANLLLHPATVSPIETVADKQEYLSDINVYLTTSVEEATVDLSIFYGTEPESLTFENGEFTSFGRTFPTKYLQSNYATDAEGKKSIVTVLFPHDAVHAKADMTRIAGTGYTGASIQQGSNVIDYALESDGSAAVHHEGTSFQGLSALYRKLGSDNGYYFLRKGRSFDHGTVVRTGFSSDSDISIYMDGAQGNVIAPETTDMVFYHKDIKSVLLNGTPAVIKAIGKDWVKIEVPAGSYDISLEMLKTTGAAPLTATITSIASVNPVTREVNLSGAISSGAGKDIQIKVMNASNEIDYMNHTVSDASGNYSFTYTLDEAIEGSYSVYVSGTNVDTPVSDAFSYLISSTDTSSDSETPSEWSNGTATILDVPQGLLTSTGSNTGIETTAVLDVESGKAKADIPAQAISDALDQVIADANGVKTLEIHIPKVDGAAGYESILPGSLIQASKKTVEIKVATELGVVTLPNNLLGSRNNSQPEHISLTITMADISTLDESTKSAIGNKPVIDLSLSVDGSRINWNNPEAAVIVSVPYEPSDSEKLQPEHIVVWYIDASGSIVSVPSGKYDEATGFVTFRTTHFSTYAVSFVVKSFADLSAHQWAKKEIEVLASKGVINGTSPYTFVPSDTITRADFLMLLIQALGIEAKDEAGFEDVTPADYYYPAVSAARKLGIAEGSGGNLFHPKAPITRADMMVLVARALNNTGHLRNEVSDSYLSGFTDQDEIAPYAKDSVNLLVQEGIVMGTGEAILPKDSTTRAEAAVLIYRVYYLQ